MLHSTVLNFCSGETVRDVYSGSFFARWVVSPTSRLFLPVRVLFLKTYTKLQLILVPLNFCFCHKFSTRRNEFFVVHLEEQSSSFHKFTSSQHPVFDLQSTKCLASVSQFLCSGSSAISISVCWWSSPECWLHFLWGSSPDTPCCSADETMGWSSTVSCKSEDTRKFEERTHGNSRRCFSLDKCQVCLWKTNDKAQHIWVPEDS